MSDFEIKRKEGTYTVVTKNGSERKASLVETALCDRIEQLEQFQQWANIKTAPKDGQWFIARDRYGNIFKCRWGTGEVYAIERGGLPSDYRDSWDDGWDEVRPVKWLPCSLDLLDENNDDD